jgi:ATP-dependent Lon protease
MLKEIITDFTVESGVRNLERAIGSVCRVVAYDYAICKDRESFKLRRVDNELIEKALGTQRVDSSLNERITRPGCATGLAYTENGGRALLIETAKYPGSG